MKKYKDIWIPFLMVGLCIAAACCSVALNRIYDIYLNIGFYIPCIYGCFGKGRYAKLCSLAAFVSAFFVPDRHGFACMVPAAVMLLWNAGHIGLWRWGEGRRFSFLASYLYEIAMAALTLWAGIPVCHYLAELNRYYPFGYAYSYLPYNIINAGMLFLQETFVLAFLILDMLRTLPAVKKRMGRKVCINESSNDQLAFIILLAAVIVFLLSIPSDREGIAYFTISINSYENAVGNLQLLLFKEILVFLIGNFAVHFMEYFCRQESEKLETAELQKAVFESSDDLIWSVSGKSGEIITANSRAKDFFLKKAGREKKRFLDLFDKNEMDLWSEYLSVGAERGKYATEYYDGTVQRYYSLVVSRVPLEQKDYDIAFFAKDMTEEVELNEQIRSINSQLEDKIKEKTRDLEQSYRDLNQYTHQIAHEIKAPMRAIQLYNEIVKEGLSSGKKDETEEASRQIDHYCRKSLNMLSEILDYSKARTQSLKIEPVDMYELVSDTVQELCSLYKGKEVTCSISRLPGIRGDRELLRSCVYNILSNSFKYSSKKDIIRIEVTGYRAEGACVFSFRDHGAGFDMEYAGHLFEMFCRMHTDSEFEGTGIGLALVKNIIERHGGTVSAEAYPDQGCIIRVSLPDRAEG